MIPLSDRLPVHAISQFCGETRTEAPRSSRRARPATPEAIYLCAILSMGSSSRNQLRCAQKVIDRFGSLSSVINASNFELVEDSFVGAVGATKIAVTNRLILQAAYAPLRNRPLLENLDDLIPYLLLTAGHARNEQMRLLSLNVKGHVLHDELVSEGTPTFVHVDIRTIIACASRNFASSIILVHNHPSGDPEPSCRDIDFTSQIGRSAALIEVNLADHFIIAGSRWFSFRENGLIHRHLRSDV